MAQLLGAGHSRTEVAAQLGKSLSSVHSTVGKVKAKTGGRPDIELAASLDVLPASTTPAIAGYQPPDSTAGLLADLARCHTLPIDTQVPLLAQLLTAGVATRLRTWAGLNTSAAARVAGVPRDCLCRWELGSLPARLTSSTARYLHWLRLVAREYSAADAVPLGGRHPPDNWADVLT